MFRPSSSSFSRPVGLLAALLVVPLLALAPAVAQDRKPATEISLRDLDNKTRTLAEFKGKVVLMNFWATWCGPCQVEMPHLEAMYKEFGDKGFVVLGISVDDARSSSMVKPLIKSKGLTYPILLDQQTTVVSQYNPSKTMPYNVLIDRSGNIAQVFSGYNPGDEVKLRAAVEALLQ